MNESLDELRQRLARRHHLAGWSGLLLFLTLGAALEALHGFKVGAYLDPAYKIRREMWTLAHAHGTLLALVQVAFAVSVVKFGRWPGGLPGVLSFFLLGALLLSPVGFWLGGRTPRRTDPGGGVLLVPLGAVLLFVAVAGIVWSAWLGRRGEP